MAEMIIFSIVNFIVLGLLIYLFSSAMHSMFTSRRTVVRLFGWGITFLILACIFLPLLSGGGGATASAEATKIVNDLRNLRGAAISFRETHGRSPLPGEEASLDLYSDRPIVAAEPPRYAKVTLSGELSDDVGYSRQYIGIELIPGNNGTRRIQQKLAAKANDTGMLGELPSGDKKAPPYTSGLNVYMEIPLN